MRFFLARRTSSPAAARTWVTEPGPASSWSLHMVWMESITTRSKSPDFTPSMTSRRLVSAASWTVAWARPMRWARARTCSMASSPET